MVKAEYIGTRQLGIDGSDEYLRVTTEEEGMISQAQVDAFFHHNYYQDTRVEAGGYYCHTYDWLVFPWGNAGVLVVYHRYDV